MFGQGKADTLRKNFLSCLEKAKQNDSQLNLFDRIADDLELGDLPTNIQCHLSNYKEAVDNIQNIDFLAKQVAEGQVEHPDRFYANIQAPQLGKWMDVLAQGITSYLFKSKSVPNHLELKDEFVDVLGWTELHEAYKHFSVNEMNRLITVAFINIAIGALHDDKALTFIEQAKYFTIGTELIHNEFFPDYLKQRADFIKDIRRFLLRIEAYIWKLNKDLKNAFVFASRIRDKLAGAEQIKKLLQNLLSLLEEPDREKEHQFNKELDAFRKYVHSSECSKGILTKTFSDFHKTLEVLVKNVKKFFPEAGVEYSEEQMP